MSLPGLEKSLSFKSKTSKELSDAEVEINDNIGLYGIMNLGDTGAYVKAMVSSHNIIMHRECLFK